MADLPKHHFVPRLTDPDRCMWSLDEQMCESYRNNYVAHFQEGDGSRRPESVVDVQPAKPIMPPTPELDKLSAVKSQSQSIGEFLEWLLSKEFHIAKYHDGVSSHETASWGGPIGSVGLVQVNKSIEQWLADYFDIDLQQCENEKLELLSYVRAHNGRG